MSMIRVRSLASISVVLVAVVACQSPPASSPQERSAAVSPPVDEEPLPSVASPYDALPEAARALLDAPFTGDFDEMIKRRIIRAGVVFNRTQYFVDRGIQRGMAYDSLVLFEEQVNKRLKTGPLKVHVAFVPLSRDEMLSALTSGKVDLVAATITVTPERQKIVAFSNPTRTGVSEIVVTGKDVSPLATADDLSGREVFVRRSSSYYESLTRLNADLKQRGKPEVTVRDAPEALEDDDLLEMVSAGLVDAVVVHDFVASFWQKVFPGIQLHPGAKLRTDGSIAVAVRKENPRLQQAINIWIKEYGPRTAFGNSLEREYLQSTRYVTRAADQAERQKFEKVVKLFQTYGDRYKLDYLLMAAQAYQESRLDQQAKSRVGAIGIMQVMPATGKELAVGDITQLEPNIHAGVKYMRFMMDQYYKDEPMDALNKGLMTFASYNAGPGRMAQLRREAAKRGLDPNVWFGNVERIASERIGRETVQYVSNIYKYYVAYRLTVEQRDLKEALKAKVADRK
jgi:membrane-bound lytic murein transglycosylase MltF